MFQLRLSDWIALPACGGLLSVAMAAMMHAFGQGMMYSDAVGIEAAGRWPEVFSCRADAAFEIAAWALGASLLLRLAHLRGTRQMILAALFVRAILDQLGAVFLAMCAFWSFAGAEVYLKDAIWNHLIRRCGAG